MARGPIYMAKMFRAGNSWVLSLEKDLREALQLRPGDSVMIRVHPPFATFRRAVPELAVPLANLHPEDFPPAWPYRSKDATRGDAKEGAASRTTGPDASDDGRDGSK